MNTEELRKNTEKKTKSFTLPFFSSHHAPKEKNALSFHQRAVIRRRQEKLDSSLSQRIVLWVFFAIFLVYALSLLLPFFYILTNSFYTASIYSDRPDVRNLLRSDLFSFKNYIQAFNKSLVVATPDGREVYLFGMTGNSLLYILITAVPNIFSSLLAAYVMSKFKFPGKKVLFSFIIAIQVIPILGAGSAYYKLLVEDLQIANKPWIYWIVNLGGFDFAFVLFYGYYNSVSWEYGEAAEIDGASNWQIFTRIMIPMAKPIIAALFITQAISNWNDYTTPYLYLEDYPTLSYGLFKYYSDAIYTGGGNMPLLFAGIVLSTIPVLILYIVFHKTIMENTVAGGLKG